MKKRTYYVLVSNTGETLTIYNPDTGKDETWKFDDRREAEGQLQENYADGIFYRGEGWHVETREEFVPEDDKKKIIIVVAGGRVESVFSNEEVEVEIVDFDGANEEEQADLGDYVDACRETMKEVIC